MVILACGGLSYKAYVSFSCVGFSSFLLQNRESMDDGFVVNCFSNIRFLKHFRIKLHDV